MGGVTKARRVVNRDASKRWVESLARLGLASVGVSFALVALLALKMALVGGGAATDRQGALAKLAQTGWGKPALLVISIGFAGYALWRFVLAFTGEELEDGEDKGWIKRAGYLVRALFYSGLAFATLRLTLGGGSGGGGSQTQQKGAATLLGLPGGRLMVGGIGVVIIAAGAFNGYRAITRTYEEKLKMWEIPKARQHVINLIARAGLFARMVVFGIIGWFFLRAAVEYDPKKAIGLDGALRELAMQSNGRLLLFLVALGLLAYALYRGVEARYRTV